MLIWIFVKIAFMENERDLDFSELGKKRREKNWSLCIQMYGDLLRYHLLVAPGIILGANFSPRAKFKGF